MIFRKVWTIMMSIFTLGSVALMANNYNLNDRLPVDENIVIGQLENGLTYYIKKNNEPTNFAELRLAIKAGSILEDDDQRGLAHFTEHMAFNGSEHFPGNSLNDYLSSIGFGFLGGLNAMTSFDETIYVLTSRTNDKEQLDKAFLILSDWAARLTLDDDAIESERGIIIEEWRGGRGANERMFSQQRRTIFGDSKYAERMPIGTLDVLENFEPQRLRDYFNDWYRPDLQAVVAVGDFEIEEIKGLIVKHFGDIPARENPRLRESFPVPISAETKFSFATDKEATSTTISIMFKHLPKVTETIADYRSSLVVSLLNTMLNNRFSEIARQANPPFLSAAAYKHDIARTLNTYTVAATVDDTKIVEGYTALITELERAKRHNFYESELIRAKDIILNRLERDFEERDKTHSNRQVWPIINHFTRNAYLMNIEYEFELANYLFNTITLADIREALLDNVTENNRVITLTGSDGLDEALPSESAIISLFSQIANSELEHYPETILNESLLSDIPTPVKVKKPKYDRKFDLYTWKLPNGGEVYLKTTNFRNNEILFSAYRKGGLSQANDDIFNAARMATTMVSEGGLGDLDKIQLNSFLAGKDAQLRAETRPKNESLSGRSSVKDFSIMMQMLYLYCTAPRMNEIAAEIWKSRTEVSLRNVHNSPEFRFNEILNNLLYDNHLRVRQFTSNSIININTFDAFNFYRARYTSAADFKFFFVGNIDHQTLHNYIETYIATLPDTKVPTNIVNRNQRFSQTSQRRDIYHGQDNKTLVRLIFTNDYNYNLKENRKLNAMSFVLNEMLLENIREKISGVYSIHAYPVIENDPIKQLALHINFGCAPERVDEIIEAINDQVTILMNNTFDDKYLTNFKETQKQRNQRNIRTNRYWLDQIETMTFHNYNKNDVLNVIPFIEKISRKDIADITKKYIDYQKKLIVVLYPE